MTLNTIHLGDIRQTLQTLDDNSVDITITSPPYNKQDESGGLVKRVEYKSNSDNLWEEEYQHQQVMILDQLWRITKPGGHIFYNHKLRWQNGKMIHPYEWLRRTVWDMRQELIWDRTIAGNLRGWRFWQTEERIYWMQKGLTKGDELESRHAKMSSIWRLRPEAGFKNHPAPFPIEFPVRCIYSIADLQTGLTVLDPYSGTGSTAVAAKIMGHNYIGIDCSPEYVKIAEDRLAALDDVENVDGTQDIERVCAEMNLHNVEKTYAQRKSSKLQRI